MIRKNLLKSGNFISHEGRRKRIHFTKEKKRTIAAWIILASASGAVISLNVFLSIWPEIPEINSVLFPSAGPDGAVLLSENYEAGLTRGDAYDPGENGQGIVDQDNMALLAEIRIADDEGNDVFTVPAVLDHDSGTPPALAAVYASRQMWIREKDGTTRSYRKVHSVHTGSRSAEDMITSEGENVLTEKYLNSIGDSESWKNHENLILFIVCEGDGRRVTFWTLSSENSENTAMRRSLSVSMKEIS